VAEVLEIFDLEPDTPETEGVLEPELEALEQILKNHKVKEAHIFGSAVKGSFTKDSDLDLLIEFEKGIDPSSFLRVTDSPYREVVPPSAKYHFNDYKRHTYTAWPAWR
jgi:predicted nucleotidyltransferase